MRAARQFDRTCFEACLPQWPTYAGMSGWVAGLGQTAKMQPRLSRGAGRRRGPIRPKAVTRPDLLQNVAVGPGLPPGMCRSVASATRAADASRRRQRQRDGLHARAHRQLRRRRCAKQPMSPDVRRPLPRRQRLLHPTDVRDRGDEPVVRDVRWIAAARTRLPRRPAPAPNSRRRRPVRESVHVEINMRSGRARP